VYEFGGGKVREHLGGIYDFLQTKKISELSELEKSQKEANSLFRGNQQFPPGKVSVPSEESPSFPHGNNQGTLSKALSYAEHKELQKRKNRAEKAVKESERKIEKMEQRLKELDDLLMVPENASDMTLVTEYTSTKKSLDEEVERWEKLSEELESLTTN
jgi:ATP-binding cassette subfamily F protein 3